MSKTFITEVSNKLNPIIGNWVDYNVTLGLIKEYQLRRYLNTDNGYSGSMNFYVVRIELANGYDIDIDISKCRSKHKTCKILSVCALAPAVERLSNGNGGTDVCPRKVVKERIEFVEGEFDIKDVEWLTRITRLLNEYVMKTKISVEVIE